METTKFSWTEMTTLDLTSTSSVMAKTTTQPGIGVTWNMNMSGSFKCNDSHESFDFDPVLDFYIDTVLVGFISLLGFVSNITAFVVFCFVKPRQSTTLLLQALAISDCFFIIGSLLYHTLRSVYPYTGIGHAYWDTFPTVQVYVLPPWYITQTISTWLIVCISMDRYFQVCKPKKYSNKILVLRAWKMIIGVVLTAIVYNLPRFFEFRTETLKSYCSNKTVTLRSSTEMNDHLVYQIVYKVIMYFLVMYVIPVSMLVASNALLVKKLKKSSKILQRNPSNSFTIKTNAKENRVTHIVIAIIIAFLICVAPDLFLQVFMSTDQVSLSLTHTFALFSNFFLVLNPLINFFIYFVLGRRFRRHLLKSLRDWCKKKKQNADIHESDISDKDNGL